MLGVAVPPSTPRNQNMSRVQAIVASSQAMVGLTNQPLDNIEGLVCPKPELAELRWIATIASDLVEAWQEPELSSDTWLFSSTRQALRVHRRVSW